MRTGKLGQKNIHIYAKQQLILFDIWEENSNPHCSAPNVLWAPWNMYVYVKGHHNAIWVFISL